MESLRANYKDEDEEEEDDHELNHTNLINQTKPTTSTTTTTSTSIVVKQEESTNNSDGVSEEQLSVQENQEHDLQQPPQSQQSPNSITQEESLNPITAEDDEEEDEEETAPRKKRKHLSSLAPPESNSLAPKLKKSKKKKKPKTTNVWSKTSSRKGKKKTKPNAHQVVAEKSIMISPIPRMLDRSDDSKDAKICLSKVYKAEKVELSDDRLTAGSTKGYRMVRATRGVVNGAWYFEIKIEKLGESGHTRLGWSTEKGDLQAPVGFDGNSYGYRDIDGSKIHKAMREKYGEDGYVEGDIIGFYINLPDGELFAPKTPNYMWYKGHRYAYPPNPKEESNKVVPGSEISFFKNGVCQGVAFKDLFGGCYYPAASMYTLPNQPNCVVKFNFGPEFAYYPKDLGDRPIPTPMIEVPYPAMDDVAENGEATAKEPLQNT